MGGETEEKNFGIHLRRMGDCRIEAGNLVAIIGRNEPKKLISECPVWTRQIPGVGGKKPNTRHAGLPAASNNELSTIGRREKIKLCWLSKGISRRGRK